MSKSGYFKSRTGGDAGGPRIAFVCNHSFGLKTLYRGLFLHLTQKGYGCQIVVGEDSFIGPRKSLEGVPVNVVGMVREPSLLADIVSLWRMIGFFRRHRFDVVHLSTPKGAFLGAIAARLTGHRNIIFIVLIRVYQDRAGLNRWILEKLDWIVCRLSSVVAPVSREMAEEMIRDGVCPPEKISLLGNGSTNGIDVRRFDRSPANVAMGQSFRERHGIPGDARLLVCMCRLARGKGVDYLPAVMDALSNMGSPAWLLVAGPVDSREPTDPATLAALDDHPRIVRIGYQEDPVPVYAAGDLFLFPTTREGLPTVALEAQAMKLPVTAFDTYGVREAVRDGVTGLLAPEDRADLLAGHVHRLLGDEALRAEMAEAARRHILADFHNELVWSDLRREIASLSGESVRSEAFSNNALQ